MLRPFRLGHGRLRLLYLGEVNCNGRARLLVVLVFADHSRSLDLAPVDHVGVVYEWHLRAVRLALIHALATASGRFDLLDRRLRYVALAQHVRCVFVYFGVL
jgi:hypothetical protein